MGRLTTHVLDTAQGKPGDRHSRRVVRRRTRARRLIATARTNDDGRCDAPLLQGDTIPHRTLGVGVPRRRVLCRRGPGAARSAVPGSGLGGVRNSRGRPLPRTAAGLAVELHHLPRQLTRSEVAAAAPSVPACARRVGHYCRSAYPAARHSLNDAARLADQREVEFRAILDRRPRADRPCPTRASVPSVTTSMTRESNCGSANTHTPPNSRTLSRISADSLYARSPLRVDRDGAGGIQVETLLKVPIGIVQDDERLVANRSEFRVDLRKQLVQPVDQRIRRWSRRWRRGRRSASDERLDDLVGHQHGVFGIEPEVKVDVAMLVGHARDRGNRRRRRGGGRRLPRPRRGSCSSNAPPSRSGLRSIPFRRQPAAPPALSSPRLAIGAARATSLCSSIRKMTRAFWTAPRRRRDAC